MALECLGELAQACDLGATGAGETVRETSSDLEMGTKSRSNFHNPFSSEEGDKFTESASRGR